MNDDARRSRRVAAAPPIPPDRVRSWARSAYRFFVHQYFRAEYHGFEHVPSEGRAVVIANHPSYLDPYTIGYGFERWITWMAWEDAFDWPLVGKLVGGLGAFPVNLDRPRPSTLKTAAAVLEAERVLGIFFEGGRTLEGEWQLSEPRPGAALVALRAGAPIVPVSLAGKRRAWPYDGWVPRPRKVVVRCHAPIETHGYRPDLPLRERAERLTADVAERIRSGLPADGRHV